MKNKYAKLFPVFIILFFYSCNEEVEMPKLECSAANFRPNQTVEKIKETASTTATKYLYDDIIEAYVVSSDEGGNFFKTISMQTIPTETMPAVGFSISVDASNTYIDYRVGNKVYIKLKNQFTDLSFGGMRVGSLYESGTGSASIGRIPQNDYKNVLNASCTMVDEKQLLKQISIEEALDDSKLNTLVELKDVQFTEAAMGRHYFEETNNVGGATNWNLRDKTGNQIIFRTSSFADFATSFVPEGNGNIRGVLTKFGSDYQLVARYERDVDMKGSRSIPFFSEDFQTATNNSILSLPGWANIVEKGKLFWKGVVASGNGYAEYAISGTKVVSNVGWLISPEINMDEYKNEILTFRSSQHHLDVDSPLNSLEVLVSADFDGLNIDKATWETLKANFPNQSTAWNVFVGSGAIDLSKYTGNIRIAFKYTGSGKNLALDGAFQLDDVQVYGEK
ncbi:DUF5017 domain-containing protein [Flavobacterium sp. GA093]|uniref:DUF5017 domain-containing protein n=1 Tax=Flavobacterium hydrocarbonoxydans TaxID=2683249 RepID=A0A6I4NQ75_9FLAO|nr:DUF5689 domain-containing protein [Flavobacterium hydrocarbonoxydans]MWB96568.1 DUF5017 domain-containing protein [Flavobacterium hydrocarbonoxydans]